MNFGDILSRISPPRSKKKSYGMSRINWIPSREPNPIPENTTQYNSGKHRKNLSSPTETKRYTHKTYTTENFLTL